MLRTLGLTIKDSMFLNCFCKTRRCTAWLVAAACVTAAQKSAIPNWIHANFRLYSRTISCCTDHIDISSCNTPIIG